MLTRRCLTGVRQEALVRGRQDRSFDNALVHLPPRENDTIDPVSQRERLMPQMSILAFQTSHSDAEMQGTSKHGFMAAMGLRPCDAPCETSSHLVGEQFKGRLTLCNSDRVK